jgi:hypothetical protein
MVLIDGQRLYATADATLIGTADVDSAVAATDSVLSPDGNRVYRLITKANSGLVIDHIAVYDTFQWTPDSGPLTLIGQIPITDQATDCAPSYPTGCGAAGSLFISPLGDTLFWIGNHALVVIPIDSSMSGISSVKRRMLPASRK